MVKKILIHGGIPLSGEVEISGYKNTAGAILSAAILSDEPSVVDNVPLVSDALDQIEIMKQMGAKIDWLSEKKVKISPKDMSPDKIPYDLFEKMRVSVLLIGPFLARFKKFKVPHPGGDKIGLRPILSHLESLRKFGVLIEESNGFYHFEIQKDLEAKRIVLKEFSVTATENLMMLAATIPGKTVIEIAAAEPQVQDLGFMLKNMGTKVKGLGTHTIEIEGNEKLGGAGHNICPDLLEAGTFMIAIALTGGEGIIKKVNPDHLTLFLEKMKDIGVNFETGNDEISVKPSIGFRAQKIQVLPYPGFPTDLQPQTSVLLTQAQGKSLIHDPLYENRFQHLHELRKMGADIEITDPHRALIFGKTELTGSKVDASDIRSGAALILAGLAAKGETIIDNVMHIDRGYEKIDEKLQKMGAKITRV